MSNTSLEIAYNLLVLAGANFIKALEEHNLPLKEQTKKGEFDGDYIKDRFTDDLGDEFVQAVAHRLNN